MKLPQIRFTVRRMMVLVAIVALIMWGEIRRARFERVKLHLEAEWKEMASMCSDGLPSPTPESDAAAVAKINYLRTMRPKYDRAARYPWLPVDPDPPTLEEVP